MEPLDGDVCELFEPDLGNRIPQLGEARGKVVVLRNALFEGFGLPFDGASTDIQDYYKVYNTQNDNPFGPDTVSIHQKKDFIGQYLAKASTSSKLVLNFASGATGMFPDSVARRTNVFAYDAIGPVSESKTTGVLLMDFPGEKLVYRILKTNFAQTPSGSMVECSGRSWSTESDKTLAEFRIPTATAGTVYTIIGGAYARFVFPRCHRATWTDLRFSCGSSGTWLVSGSWDADGWCRSRNQDQEYLVVGRK